MSLNFPRGSEVMPRGHGNGCLIGLALNAGLLLGCATGSYQLGERAGRAGDWDAAVASYERALLEHPRRADVRIALARARIRATWNHLDTARDLEARDKLVAALAEYERALVYDPSLGAARDRITALEREISEPNTLEAPPRRPGSSAGLRTAPPLLDPSSRERLDIRFSDASLRDILDFIGDVTGINVIYDEQFQDRTYSVELNGVTLEEALDVILTANQYFYVVLNGRAIGVRSEPVRHRVRTESSAPPA